MKIICNWKNYTGEHSLHSYDIIEKPVIYLKPETAMLLNNRPFYYPDFSSEIMCNAELVLKINKVSKFIPEKFAHTYYDEIGIAINFTAIDIQAKCIENNEPWDMSYSFDNSMPLSKFIKKDIFEDLNDLKYYLKINGEPVIECSPKHYLFSTDKIISRISEFIMLKSGDLILCGPLSKGIKININDQLEAGIGEHCILKCRIR